MCKEYLNPKDAVQPIAAALAAAQFLLLDDHGKDLAHDLIAWAQETAARAAAPKHHVPEVNDAA